MSDAATRDEGPERMLRSVRRGVLGTLGVCALVVAATVRTPLPDVAPPPAYTGAAIALALASIVTRLWAQGPRTSERLRGPLFVASLLLAGAIGLVAVPLALGEGQWRTGLFYVLAGAMLSIRLPSPAARGSVGR